MLLTRAVKGHERVTTPYVGWIGTDDLLTGQVCFGNSAQLEGKCSVVDGAVRPTRLPFARGLQPAVSQP